MNCSEGKCQDTIMSVGRWYLGHAVWCETVFNSSRIQSNVSFLSLNFQASKRTRKRPSTFRLPSKQRTSRKTRRSTVIRPVPLIPTISNSSLTRLRMSSLRITFGAVVSTRTPHTARISLSWSVYSITMKIIKMTTKWCLCTKKRSQFLSLSLWSDTFSLSLELTRSLPPTSPFCGPAFSLNSLFCPSD